MRHLGDFGSPLIIRLDEKNKIQDGVGTPRDVHDNAPRSAPGVGVCTGPVFEIHSHFNASLKALQLCDQEGHRGADLQLELGNGHRGPGLILFVGHLIPT